MQKVVFIHGLGYSGSTLLNAILSSHPDMVGLGQVYSHLHDKKKPTNYSTRQCSCGKVLKKCPFWRDFRAWHEENFEQLNFIEKYRHLVKLFGRKYKGKIIVDSSKRPYVLRDLWANLDGKEIDLRIIFLMKDARGFSVSARAHRREKKKYGNVFLYQLAWWWKNRNFKKSLDKNGVRYFQVGYDELALHPKEVLKQMCQFIGVSYNDTMLKPSMTKAHIARGNRIKSNFSGRIRYDNRWVNDQAANLAYKLLPFVAHFNRRNVYRHYRDI